MADQRVLNKPRNQSVIKPEVRGKSLPRSQRGPRTNHFCHHYGLQGHTKPNCHKLRALKNAIDQRSRGLGLLSHQEVKMVISVWWTWGRWSVHSPLAWKASLEGLKILTLVPNPIGISPQMHVMCGWRGVLMHKHYNMSMH